MNQVLAKLKRGELTNNSPLACTCGDDDGGGCGDGTHSVLVLVVRGRVRTRMKRTAFAALTVEESLRAWAVSTASTPVLLHLHSESVSVLAAATTAATVAAKRRRNFLEGKGQLLLLIRKIMVFGCSFTKKVNSTLF